MYAHPLPANLDRIVCQALTCLPVDYLRETIASINGADLTKATKAERARVFSFLGLAENALALSEYSASVHTMFTNITN